ncbi:MAG TPA: filamentous hemagglutinin N-terminal domain-containing protein, partial [Usitatibacter sp.]|nr:filamentous hemagglutinin N-terminal domain-containing protein [Usitatibacter sp.]
MRRGIAVAAALLPLATAAQVRTDASLGRPAATIPGPTYSIPQAIGRVAGNNLFHSFQSFSVGYGETAVFSMAPTIANVISRVTGGEASFIRGTLRVEAGPGKPDFWLLNPAGVVFGRGAQLDVPGAFHVTTANYIRFADGELHADPAKASTFSSFSPEAFGFLGTTRAEVRFEDGAQVRSRGGVDIVAGDFTVTHAQLRGDTGDVRIVAFGARAGEVPVAGAVAGAEGAVAIRSGGSVETHASAATRGGNVGVYAGSLSLDGAGSEDFTGILALTESAAPAGAVAVAVSGEASILRGAQVATRTGSSGDAGPIRLSARNLKIEGESIEGTGVLSTSGAGTTGRPGSIDVQIAESLQVFDGGMVASNTGGAGNAGDVRVTAQDILLDGRGTDVFTGIFTKSLDYTTTGTTGSLTVDAHNNLTILGGAQISATSDGFGDSGNILVHAGTLLIDGSSTPDYATGIDSTTYVEGAGRSGDIDVRVDGKLSILYGGQIAADTYSDGNAGSVRVTARELLIDGGQSPVFTGISSDALNLGGSAGNIDVRADTAVIRYSGGIVSDTFTTGSAGSVRIVVKDLLVDGAGYDGFTGISSDTLNSSGRAGNVEIRATSIRLIDGGSIASDTYATGAAGSVLVVADSVWIEGSRPSGVASGITSSSSDAGDAGSVRVEVGGPLTIAAGGVIGTGTFSTGNAGRVSVRAGSLLIDERDARYITGLSSQTESGSTGNAGSVDVEILGDATIHGAISTATFGTGRAGSVNVRVDGDLSISATDRSLAGIYSNSVQATSGAAGDINVRVGGHLRLYAGGTISSDTYSSNDAGTVHVATNSMSIEGTSAYPFTGVSTNSWRGAGGDAGDVTVSAVGEARITQGGLIASSTLSSGNAGSVTVRAGTLVADGDGTTRPTGVTSTASAESTGNAGRIRVEATDLQLRNGATVSTTTFSPTGRAGTVEIVADRVVVDGAYEGTASAVSARSAEGASGQTGDVTISANESITLSNGGQVSIGNDSNAAEPASIVPSRIALVAPSIFLASGGSVTAQATGNVSASNIQVDARGRLAMLSGSITTEANLGNGGAISIDAGEVRLFDSRITTSV